MLLRSLLMMMLVMGCGRLRIPKAANTISLSSSVSQWVAGQCVDLTLSLSQSGAAFVVPGTTNAQIGLAGNLSNIRFYETLANCQAVTSAVESTVVAAATSSKTFYARSTTSGSLTVTTRLTGYSGTPITVSLAGTQSFTVYAATPASFMFVRQSATTTDLNGADTLSAASGCTAYSIYFKDAYGNVVSASDYSTLYTGTFATLAMNVARNAGDAALTANYDVSTCVGGTAIPDNNNANVNNAFTTYPAVFALDATTAGAHTFVLTHTLTGISPNPTLTVNVTP